MRLPYGLTCSPLGVRLVIFGPGPVGPHGPALCVLRRRPVIFRTVCLTVPPVASSASSLRGGIDRRQLNSDAPARATNGRRDCDDRDVAFYSGRFNLARLAASPYPCDFGDASLVSLPTRTPYDYERHGDRDNPEDDEY